jgi:hypothetical protein
MKQFQKIGVAAAVASVAAGAVAQSVSRTESGDLAIVPYYSVRDGINTGLHIINTTGNTQVVKVRLRRGTDSKDALDFNLVMSPLDEWTANIGGTGDESSPVVVTTNDTTCTVPEFPAGGAPMPTTFGTGADEGYIEVIGMAQVPTAAEAASHLAVGAEHADGVPFNCDMVRQHFYRVAVASVNTNTVRGVHTSEVVGSGICTNANLGVLPGSASTAALTAYCSAGAALNLTTMEDSDDNALKVSFMLTDSNGGLEAGDNAVMVEGFGDGAMMTNQQPLSFGTDGLLNYDPLNFELPNLAYGAYDSSVAARDAASTASATDGTMWTQLAEALDATSIINDWAAFDSSDGSSVNADWVVTLPGQYVMTNPICAIYTTYSEANATAAALCASSTAIASNATAAAHGTGGADQNQLPLLVASNADGGALITGSNLALWDREEDSLLGAGAQGSADLGFSPGGSAGDPNVNVTLNNEVNVIDFGEADAPSALDSDLKLTVTPSGADRGWGRLTIAPVNQTPARWNMTAADAAGGVDDGDVVPPADLTVGTFTDTDAARVPVVGFAVWERSFAAQAGNYGRMIEHSTVSSSR